MSLPDGPRSSTITQTARWLTQPLTFLDECAQRYGNVFSLRLFGVRDMIVVAEPELIRRLFTADEDTLEVNEGRYFLRSIVGDSSVLVIDGAPHARKRRLLMPPFHGERMHAYARVIRDIADDAIDAWPVGRAFKLHPVMQSITLGVIARAVFGIEDAAQRQHLVTRLTELVNSLASPLTLLPGFFKVNLFEAAPWLRASRLKAGVDALLYAEIERRRAAPAPGEDILSLLLAARDEDGLPLSDTELRDELFTVLVAGYETTATALAWTMGLVLRHPDVRAKLEGELRAHAGDGPLDPASLSKLELLDAVIKEALRLYPVVPIVSRIPKKPYPLGKYTAPKGTRISTGIYLLHRRPDLYPEPLRFNPARFLGKKVDPYAWIPFGGGIRRCVGMAFAMCELKVVLASVLLRARLAPASAGAPRPIQRSVTIAPADGAPVVLERRAPRQREARPS